MIKLLQITVFAFLLAGCARSVEVETEFPEPIVEPLPLTVGIRFPEELANYVHVEDPLMDSEWTIRIGEANVEMFRTIFAAMFTRVMELDAGNMGEPATGVDAIIEPRLEELEFTVPAQAGNDQYTVWIRYNLKILAGDGQLVGNWRITAYGQEDQGIMGMGAENSMEQAATTALRDAAATIVIGFAKAPGVQKKLLNTDDAKPDKTS